MTKNIINKACTCLIVFVMIIIGLHINSLAATEGEYTCDLSLVPEKTKIKAGETVIIDVNVSNINAGNGVALIAGILEYESSDFEEKFKVEKDDDGKWNNEVLDNFIQFVTANKEGTIEENTIGKIELTAKQDVTLGEKIIKFTKIDVAADDGTKIKINDISTKVEIVDETIEPDDPKEPDDPSDPNDPDEPSDPNDPDDPNNQKDPVKPDDKNNTGNNQIKPTPIDNGKSDNKLPKTGNTNILAIGIIGAVLITVVFYIKYRRSY